MRHPAARPVTTSVLAAVAVLAAVLVALGLHRGADDPAAAQTVTSPSVEDPAVTNPVVDGSGATGNVAFYYDGTIDLPGADPDMLRNVLGNPAVVVTVRSDDEAGTVDAIHSIGAKAYRYVQLFWLPSGDSYDGVDIADHPDWAFCRRGNVRSIGRIMQHGTQKWYFLDTNETAVRQYFQQLLESLRAEGWDGVFIDRGQAATQYAADINHRPVWSRRSTCTDDPAVPGATFADSYVNAVKLAHRVGLQAMFNNGKSPFDSQPAMRPDPGDRDCLAERWRNCGTLGDVWRNVDLVLNEGASRPTDEKWRSLFTANRRSEDDLRHGRRTVALVTTATLGGQQHQNRRDVYYAWSRIKLFDLATAVNTGNDYCIDSDPQAVCNRYGTYPELVDAAFGTVRGDGPVASGCRSAQRPHCVWTRAYSAGIDVVNATDSRRRAVDVAVPGPACRYVLDIWTQEPLGGNQCVDRVTLDMRPWTGRPLRLSTQPW